MPVYNPELAPVDLTPTSFDLPGVRLVDRVRFGSSRFRCSVEAFPRCGLGLAEGCLEI
jgi:hypothetical protein